ncbi:WD repeat and FYVE domain-containing protein 1-like [Symsagittifera roscoffensis]|uniref:WD repeat and FYVE domain-containing protein 1-like n=1 Tax=Symsagittifera roscoffensis TaxID=84072 RepID=UPI00307BAFAB
MLDIINRFECQVNAFAIVSKEDGVITVSNDKSLKVWLKRDNGQYWPSICHFLPDFGTAIAFNERLLKIFIGLNVGVVEEFRVAEDFNSVSLERDFHAHQRPVTDIIYAQAQEYLLSCSRDKTFQYFHTHNGVRIGRISLDSQVLCLAFDALSNHVFLGEYNGAISMFLLGDTEYQLVTKFHGHEGSCRQLLWEPELKWLVSCSFDQVVVVWDVGGNKGKSFELRYHKGKVNAIVLMKQQMRLISSAEDAHLVFWKLDKQREPATVWEDCDSCQLCAGPFFWSFRQMYEDRTIGKRQHHCRKCGKALCANCCPHSSVMPKMGFEFPVRLCTDCFDSVPEADKVSLAKRHNVKSAVHLMTYDQSRSLIVTASRDNWIKFIKVSDEAHQ